MKTSPLPEQFPAFLRRKPPSWAALISTVLAAVLWWYLRFVVFPDYLIPLGYGLPLFLVLWHRDKRQMYALAVFFTGLAFVKSFVMPPTSGPQGMGIQLLFFFMSIVTVWTVALALHLAVRGYERLGARGDELQDANQELEAANEELARREEEVVQQNEELQTQAEELERQAEELRSQAEELEQQTVELHAANDELTRRERGLQTLLESARWMRSDLSERDVMSAVCQAAVQVMEEGVTAAAVVHNAGGTLALRGHFGFGVHGTLREEVPFHQTFAHLVMDRRQTAYIADLQARPDFAVPQPAAGRVFRSILATPLIIEGRIAGAVEVYSPQPREWTDGEFKVIEWLAAQCALALQAIEYQQEVVVKRREAEEASVQKTRFLAAVSHDVRTPANAISLLADLIEQAAAAPADPPAGGSGGDGAVIARAELPNLVRDLKVNARSLVELVSDVLDLARLDAGKLDVQAQTFPLLPLLQNEVRHFEHIAAEKHLRLSLHPVPPGAGPGEEARRGGGLMLRTDRMKLARIVANLLGNAVKFTHAGAVDVRTTFTPAGALQIAIADTGVGIPKEALPRIFDEFYQLQNPERDRNKGSGLGLAICRRLVEALGCTLAVESTVGLGTTFTITLPPELVVAEVQETNHVAQGTPPAGGTDKHADTPLAPGRGQTLQHVKVLLVEDHDVTRRAAMRLLTAAGAQVLEARTGREALHLLVNDQPHVLLLDLMLPDGDGTDILRHMKVHRPASLRCVLAVSGDVRDARVSEVKALGADDLIAKPLDISRLLTAIATRLGSGDGRA
jgi:signal transduction histidine kinase/ActR/RegA family two-component response regulator